ncbi:efflux RND transporter periplasmic adaptor subunit [Marinilabiliaceae bacterium JC017]|nr:efflux RND transporter periplasmic adaptor subunit [Marinilabiliaceae bacterium JC017]
MKQLTIICAATLLFLSCSSRNQQQLPPQEIPVFKAVQEDVPITKEFVGQTYGLFDIAIRARVDGYLEGMHFEEGKPVKKGQLLYTIDPAPFDAKVAEAMSRVAEAKTSLVKAESDYNRYKPLAETNAVSQSDYDAAVASFGAAKAAVEAAEASLDYAKIQQSYTKLYAPINGIIGRSEAKVSDYVGREPNPVVLNTVSRIDTILVRFAISELEFLQLIKYAKTQETMTRNEGERTDIELIFADESVHDYLGKVDFIDRQIDPTTGTLALQASFPNPKRLIRPGQFAKIRAIVDDMKDVVIVPQKCVQEIQGNYNVFVVNGENQVEFRKVEVGQTIDDMWIIESGLNAGEMIVMEGINRVKTGMIIVPVPTEFDSIRNKNQD